MEREFLMGIDFDLYVNKPTYESWVNLLTGLVMAKEKDSKHWQRSRCSVRASHLARPQCHRHAHLSVSRAVSHRARSSSPRRASICAVSHPTSYPQPHHLTPVPPPQPQPQPAHHSPAYSSPARPEVPAGCKRTASDAFSPTSASFPSAAQQPPAQVARRMQGLSLDIPQPTAHAHSRESSASPLESLQSFSKLTLGASPVDASSAPAWPAVRPEEYPRTLVSAYRMDDQRPPTVPQVRRRSIVVCATMMLTTFAALVLLLSGRVADGVRGGAAHTQSSSPLPPGPAPHRSCDSLPAGDADGRAVRVCQPVRDTLARPRSSACATAVLGGLTKLAVLLGRADVGAHATSPHPNRAPGAPQLDHPFRTVCERGSPGRALLHYINARPDPALLQGARAASIITFGCHIVVHYLQFRTLWGVHGLLRTAHITYYRIAYCTYQLHSPSTLMSTMSRTALLAHCAL